MYVSGIFRYLGIILYLTGYGSRNWMVFNFGQLFKKNIFEYFELSLGLVLPFPLCIRGTNCVTHTNHHLLGRRFSDLPNFRPDFRLWVKQIIGLLEVMF